MASPNNAIVEKKDLHVGGVGSRAPASRAGTAHLMDVRDASGVWSNGALNAVRNADGYVRDNPWAAVGVSAFIGLAAGYLLSQRT
jgi:ElaB/YqjD/DUF883 family membrane-anchored ribosome-binding protein